MEKGKAPSHGDGANDTSYKQKLDERQKLSAYKTDYSKNDGTYQDENGLTSPREKKKDHLPKVWREMK